MMLRLLDVRVAYQLPVLRVIVLDVAAGYNWCIRGRSGCV